MKRLGGIIFFLFLLNAVRLAAAEAVEDPTAVFRKANAAYREGKYAMAASLYESLVEKGWKKGEVSYNLGNAQFKLNHFGQAIVNYERAKRLHPRDRDTLANLSYVQGLLEYRVEDKRNWYFRATETILSSFTTEEIAILSLGVAMSFWISWLISLYRQPNTPWGWRRKVLLGLTLIFLSLWGTKGLHGASIREAIALKSEVAVRYGPSHKDQVAFRLGEGIKVRVKKTAEEWYQVMLRNGETGWMFREDLELI